jgi:hypothetical protein
MGSNSGSNGGSADAPMTTRSTLSTKNQQKLSDRNQKNKTEFGYDKPKSALEKVGDFVKTGGFIGAAVRGVTKAVRRGRVNTSLMGTSDYQGSSTRSSATNSMNDGRGNNNNGNQVVQAPKVISPTTAEVSQSSISATPEVTLKKRRGRGRSLMIATSPEGVKDQSLTLSQKTLLG